mgnify:CR=1 FL=1
MIQAKASMASQPCSVGECSAFSTACVAKQRQVHAQHGLSAPPVENGEVMR